MGAKLKEFKNKFEIGPVVWLSRWLIIIGCAAFVLNGILRSYSKYSSGQTSVSMRRNETKTHVYPSVTFCPKLKYDKDIAMDILNQDILDEYVASGYDQKVIDEALDEWTWSLDEFLEVFSHPEFGDPYTGRHILTNSSYWKISIPHQHLSGRCFTYDPTFQSSQGWWYGIRFGYILPYWNDLEGKSNALVDIHTFLHDKDQFVFYTQGDYPSNYKLDQSLLRYKGTTNAAIKYKKFEAMSHENRPCTKEEGYSMQQCMDNYYDRQRGCYPPWQVRTENDPELLPCTNLTHIQNWFNRHGKGRQNYDRAYFTPMGAYLETGCPMPCIASHFSTDLSYEYFSRRSYLSVTDLNSEWVVHLWFQNFLFTHETEYVVCDWTCLLGEVGGNLGFFLGGSILGYVDAIIKTKWRN